VSRHEHCQTRSVLLALFPVIVHELISVMLVACIGRYENYEMRTVVLADASGASAGLDPNWFPGGHQLSRATFDASLDSR